MVEKIVWREDGRWKMEERGWKFKNTPQTSVENKNLHNLQNQWEKKQFIIDNSPQ